MSWNLRAWRSNLRLTSALVMLTFVICHLTAHSVLLISLDRGEAALDILMYPWRTGIGTACLLSALLVHYSNALWSIYVRRSLRLSRWEWWQLGARPLHPVAADVHVVSDAHRRERARRHEPLQLGPDRSVADDRRGSAVLQALGGADRVDPCLHRHPFLAAHQSLVSRLAAVVFGFGLLLPTLALAGYVTAGNQMLREAKNPDYAKLSLEDSNLTDQTRAEIGAWREIGSGIHLALVVLPFAGRGVRGWLYRRRRPPLLTHPSGRTVPILAGATVLETLRENGIPHASVCGGRARCTTCRILVTKGLERLPAADRDWRPRRWPASERRPACGSPARFVRPPTSPSCRFSPPMPAPPTARSAAASRAASG